MNILLSSVGRRGYLAEYFREALNGRGLVIGTNSVANTSGMLACDRMEKVPVCFDESFIPTMLDICQKYQIRLLFSLHDFELSYLAEHRKEFESIGTRLVIADSSFLDISLDKYRTAEWIRSIGLHAPRSYCSSAEFLTAISSVENSSQKPISFPVVIKPRLGFGSLGLYFAEDREEFDFFTRKATKEVTKTLTAYGSDQSQREIGITIQECVVGQEYGLDIVNDLNGHFVTTLIERKLAMRSGETDSAVVVQDDSLFELGKTISSHSHHPGNLDVDVIVQDGVPYVIEMNPRFGGHYPFAHMAGVNIPAALIAWTEETPTKPEWFLPRIGTQCVKALQMVLVPGE